MLFPIKYLKLLHFKKQLLEISIIFEPKLHKNVKKHWIYELYGQNFIIAWILADFARKNIGILKYRT